MADDPKDEDQEPRMAQQVVGSYIKIPESGDTVGLVLDLEDGSDRKALLSWNAAKELAETALGACQVLEDLASKAGEPANLFSFNADTMTIEPGFRPDQASITIHSGEGRIRFLIDLDVFMQVIAKLIKEIEQDSSLSGKLH